MITARKTYMVTGAGSGFGLGIVLALAKAGESVIATVETDTQAAELAKEAEKRKLHMQIETLNLKSPEDRTKAADWDVDVLLNNAAVSLGGSLIDIPESVLREQYEVNLFGTLLLTQIVVRQMLPKRAGKVVFVSSMHGLMADPISGPYCGTKFALEASAESLRAELQQYGIEVAVINPGPYLTGLNDREYESMKRWPEAVAPTLYDYEQMAFPYEQIKRIDAVVKGTIEVMTSESNDYRTVIPAALGSIAKKRQKDLWSLKSAEDLHEPHPLIQRSYDMEPGTGIGRGIKRILTKPFRGKKN